MNFLPKKSSGALLAVSLMVAVSGANASGNSHETELKRHVVGVFGGFTDADHETNFSFGLEYEYRINKLFGAGFVLEHTPDAHHGDGTTIYMGQVHLHPWKELRLSVGFGQEDIHHEGAHSEDVWRFGAAYDFHLGAFGLAPSFSVDRINGHSAKVFGVALTKGF